MWNKNRKKACILQDTLASYCYLLVVGLTEVVHYGSLFIVCCMESIRYMYVCMYTHTFSLTHRMLINIHKSKKCLCECNKYYNTAIPHCSHIRREIFSTLLSHVSRTQVYCVLAWQTRNSIVDQFKNHFLSTVHIHSFAFWTHGHGIFTSKLP